MTTLESPIVLTDEERRQAEDQFNAYESARNEELAAGRRSGEAPEITTGILDVPPAFGESTYSGASGVDDRARRFRRIENEIRRLSADTLNTVYNAQQSTRNEFLSNPIIGTGPLESLRSDVDRMRGLRQLIGGNRTAFDQVPQQLARAAQTGAASAQIQAGRTARFAGDARTGAAFGGGGSSLARKAAVQASTGGSSAIANALVQGNVARANFLQQNSQQLSSLNQSVAQVGAGLEQAIFSQLFEQKKATSDVQEQRLKRLIDPLIQTTPLTAALGGIFTADKRSDTEEFLILSQGIGNLTSIGKDSASLINFGGSDSSGGGGGGS